MQSKFLSIAVGAIGALLVSGASLAQNSDGPQFVPVDLFACNYNEGKGPADLDAVITTWNAYEDKNRQKSYAAWTLTKHYAGAEQEFDVIWLGAWKNGNEMGKSADRYLADGGDAEAGFTSVVTCDVSANFASMSAVAPPGGRTPGDSVLTFSDCTLKEGARNSDVGAAMAEWGSVLKSAGVEPGIFIWYPVFGGGDVDFDFKVIQVHPNHTALGKMYEAIGNGGLFQKQEALFGDLMDCDVSRAYNAKNIRKAQVR